MVVPPLAQALLYTLTYSSQWRFPLTTAELWSRLLVRSHQRSGLKVPARLTQTTVDRQLVWLLEHGFITRQGQFWLPANVNEPQTWVKQRGARAKHAAVKWQSVAVAVAGLKLIPWIQAIYITGSLAVDNTNKDSDSDFMIVVSSRRLWLSRMLVLLWAMGKGKRRSWQGEEKNSWCFNLWLTENAVPVLAESQSVYHAYELTQMKCVFDRHGRVTREIQAHTKWVKTFLPHAEVGERGKVFVESSAPKPQNGILSMMEEIIFTPLDLLAFGLQWLYMLRHMTQERVEWELAFFHPRPTQRLIESAWQAELKKVLH